jgi:hypothetical protein
MLFGPSPPPTAPSGFACHFEAFEYLLGVVMRASVLTVALPNPILPVCTELTAAACCVSSSVSCLHSRTCACVLRSSVPQPSCMACVVLHQLEALYVPQLLQVPGCHCDLSQASAYCQRFGYCLDHIRAPVVIIAGYPSR